MSTRPRLLKEHQLPPARGHLGESSWGARAKCCLRVKLGQVEIPPEAGRHELAVPLNGSWGDNWKSVGQS